MFSFTFSKYSNINLVIELIQIEKCVSLCSVCFTFVEKGFVSMTIRALWMASESVNTAPTTGRCVTCSNNSNKLQCKIKLVFIVCFTSQLCITFAGRAPSGSPCYPTDLCFAHRTFQPIAAPLFH